MLSATPTRVVEYGAGSADFGRITGRPPRSGDFYRYVFVRDDGWSIGATISDACDAFEIWAANYVAVFRVQSQPDGSALVERTLTPEAFLELCAAGEIGDRGLAYVRFRAERENRNRAARNRSSLARRHR